MCWAWRGSFSYQPAKYRKLVLLWRGEDKRESNDGTQNQTKSNSNFPRSHLAEVTRMVFVKVDSVVMHATSVTATSRVLAVFACNGNPQVLVFINYTNSP